MKDSLSQQITKQSGSNLALAFVLLPRAVRRDMTVLYAFCREVDDIADESNLPVEERRARLNSWRKELDRLYQGQEAQTPLGRELASIIHTHVLRREWFEEHLHGVEMDLDHTRYPDRQSLDLYCFRVASVVGLLSLPIFGARDPSATDYAIHLGKALQLTNILRDVAVDAQRDRIYLPQEDCRRFGVTEQDILQGRYSDAYRQLAESIAQWAIEHYRQAARLLPASDLRVLIAAELMGTIYWQLLRKLQRRRFNVFATSPIRLTKLQKAGWIFLCWFRNRLGLQKPLYGAT